MRISYVTPFFTILLIFAIVFSSDNCYSQIGEIEDNIRKDKHAPKSKPDSQSRSSYNYENDNSVGCNLLSEIVGKLIIYPIIGMYTFLDICQEATMDGVDSFPQRTGADFYLSANMGTDHNQWGTSQGVQANYGIFATDFQAHQMFDTTGNLSTIEWQVLKFRIPIKSFIGEIGYGFIHTLGHRRTYGEATFGVNWKVANSRFSVFPQYRITPHTTLDVPFRQSFNFRFEYDAFRTDKLHLEPFCKYSKQLYFNETIMKCLELGLLMKLY